MQADFFYQLSQEGSPRILEWVAYPFSRDLPDPGMELRSPTLQADSLPSELSGKHLQTEGWKMVGDRGESEEEGEPSRK